MTQRLRLTVALLVIVTACARAGPQRSEVEMRVRHVGFDPDNGAPVVLLESARDGRVLPIWIGAAEAQAIALELRGVTPPRPMTHDLIKQILDQIGVAVTRVRVTGLRDGTFFAQLVLSHDGRLLEVDSRPSDAIALALRVSCPIMVAAELLRGSMEGARVAGGPPTRDGPSACSAPTG